MALGPTPYLPPGTRRIPAQLWDATVEARRWIESAAAEARAMVEHAREEADSIRACAAAEGREEGLAAASELVARAALVRDRLLSEAEPQLVDLAFSVARSVLERSVERDRGAVVELAGRALEAVRHRAQVSLRAHPDDVQALRDGEPRLREQLARARCLAIVADPSLARGGVVVDTEAGAVDARLGPQIEALRRALDCALEPPAATVAPAPGEAPSDAGSGR